MRKFLLMIVAAFMMMACTGCDNSEVESSWDKAKIAQKVVKAIGKTAIEEGVVSDATADKLKKVNSAVEGAGGLAEDVYKSVNVGKKTDATTSSSEEKTPE
ncbi:hypothetical protein [Arcobacter sp.]|uniref:hypothetical protein n=1 Tax=unclassified Arcobacter TaxID=2593671 RepID=UPI003B002D71